MEKLWSLELRNKLKNTPNTPGCYLFRDNDGVIIYIGKAKFLKKRLQSYFRPHSLRNSNIKNRSLIKTQVEMGVAVRMSIIEALNHSKNKT